MLFYDVDYMLFALEKLLTITYIVRNLDNTQKTYMYILFFGCDILLKHTEGT